MKDFLNYTALDVDVSVSGSISWINYNDIFLSKCFTNNSIPMIVTNTSNFTFFGNEADDDIDTRECYLSLR